MGRRISSRTIIGREAPLKLLDGLLTEALGGRPGIALLAGEAGVGKSRLVAEMEARARTVGFVVLHGESVELGGDDFAYAPVASALRDLPSQWTRDALATMTLESRGALAALLPASGTEAPAGVPLPPGSAHGRRCVLLADLLGRLADEEAPVLLALEDVHWADRSSRDFVAYLSRNLRAHRIAAALTFRTGELAAEHPVRLLLAELARRPSVTQLDVSPLTADEVGRQLEEIAGGPVAGELAADLHARTGGNPFLVEELFAAYRAGDDRAVPATLAGALLARVRGLDPATRRVLDLVAAAGGRIGHDVLAAAVAPADPAGALHAAIDAGILVRDRDDRGVALRHRLMGEVLYADLLPGERSDLHRTIAEILAGADDVPAAQLAQQWQRAGEPGHALAASIAAGLEAARMSAFAEARRHFERSLELWDEVGPVPPVLGLDHVELLSRTAQAARWSGEHQRAIELGRRALAEFDAGSDPARAAGLLERLGEAHFWDDATALEWYGKALALLAAGPSAERARLLAAEGHALMGLGRWTEARERCEAALTMTEQTGTQEADAGALTTLGLVLAFLGEPDAGEALLRRALQRARDSGSGDDVARAYINLGELLRLRGDHGGAVAAMDDGEAFAGPAGLRGSFGQFMYVNGADDLLRLGRWQEARERLRAAERMPLGLTTEAMHRAIATQLAALCGDTSAARRRLDRALAIADGLPAEFVIPIHTAGAVLALAESDPAAARAHVEAGLAGVAPRDPLYTPPLLTAGMRAEAELAGLAQARRRPADASAAVERAAALAAELERVVAAHGGEDAPPDALAHAALGRAELARARGDPASAPWREAAARFDALNEPHPAAYARLREAEAELAAGGERARAARLLAAVAATAAALGAAGLARDAEALARRARLRPAAVPEPGDERAGEEAAGLTRREADVLRLLAEGLTNREIGTRLFISQKTVGTHVAHIFEKLDVHSRLEAAGRAEQLGVVGR